MNENLSGKLLSEESEDYSIDDIVELHKVDEEGSALIKSSDVSTQDIKPISTASFPVSSPKPPSSVSIPHPISVTKPVTLEVKPLNLQDKALLTAAIAPKVEQNNKPANVSFRIENNSLTLEDKNYDLKNLSDINTILKTISDILGNRVSSSVNKFSHMTHNESELKSLYNNLETISKNRGSAKEIIEIGSKIEKVEQEKNNSFISQEDIHKTVEDIALISSVLSKFQNILESNIYK